MLNRHNSMTSIHHQPIMPFKWRPFDLYNDIHVNGILPPPPSPSQDDTNVCERLTASNCVQCYQCELNNHHHNHVILCDGNVKEHQRHRQSSRGSSSGGSSGSCASISTVGRYFVNDIDNSDSNMDTIIDCGSIDCFCCQLDSQRLTNSAKKHHPHTNCSICYNEITISKCCTLNCRNISPKHTKIMNNKNSNHNNNYNNEKNSKSLVNRIVVMPFDGIDYTYKCEESMTGTLNHCESPSMTNTTTPITKITTKSNENIDCTTFDHCMKINHCCHAGYFDNNWMIVHRKQSDTDSKYISI